MSRRQRIVALLIAAALVFLFVSSVGNQYRRSDDELRSRYTRAVEWLGERVGGANPVLAEDFSAPCHAPEEPPAAAELQSERVDERRGGKPAGVDGVRLLVQGSCVITIAPADPDVRELTLRSDQELLVVAPALQGDATVEATVSPDEPTNLAVGPEGAEILLRCRASSECLVQIGAGDG